MAGGLVQGTTRAPFGGDVRLGGAFRLTPLADGTYLLDFTGNGAGGAGGVHAESHRAGGLDPLAGAYTGITEVGTLTGLDVSGEAAIGGSLTVTADISAGALTAGSVEVAGQLFPSAIGINFNGLLTPNPPLFSIPSGAGMCVNLDSDLLDSQDGLYYLDIANATGTAPSAAFTEAAQDAAGALWSGGGQVTYDDGAGTLAITALAATLLTGTISDLRLSSNVALENTANVFTPAQTFQANTSGSIAQVTLTNLEPVHTYSFRVGGSGSTVGNGFFALRDDTRGANVWRANPTTGEVEFTGEVQIGGDLDHNGSNVGFYGATPTARGAAFTQTYATADRTLGAYTADVESVAYTGIDNAQAGSVYATLADLNALRAAVENLRAFAEDLAQFANAAVDELQTRGLFA
jgi:hypothetical protein